MKYEELLRAYFSSVEFENSLIELYNKNKSEKIDYIDIIRTIKKSIKSKSIILKIPYDPVA